MSERENGHAVRKGGHSRLPEVTSDNRNDLMNSRIQWKFWEMKAKIEQFSIDKCNNALERCNVANCLISFHPQTSENNLKNLIERLFARDRQIQTSGAEILA